MPIALDVLLPLPLEPLTFLPPLGSVEGPVGARVVVPWQSGVRIGLVVGTRRVDAGRGLELKEAVAWLDARPYLGDAAPAALRRMARRAAAPTGLLLATFAQAAFREELRYEVMPVEGAPDLGHGLAQGRWSDAAVLPADRLELLRQQGALHERALPVRATVRVLAHARAADDALDGARRANQREALALLERLEHADSAAALARDAGVPESAVRALVEKGYAAYREVERVPPPLAGPPVDAPRPDPAPPAAVPPEADGVVTGGLRLQRLAALLPRLRSDLDAGRSVLVLAPEQAQLEEAAGALASLPLHLLSGDSSDAQRRALFEALPEGGPCVVLGTYLALLAPAPTLGRVVVLDAGNASYKLQGGARVAVQAAAEELARAYGAALTLADVVAGPEIVARFAAEERRSLPLPPLRLHAADLHTSANWPLHPDLVRVLRQVEERRRQAVVIAPRRGFSAALGCEACGWLASCPNCDLSLRFHRQDGRLRCHQCGHEERPPAACPSCGGTELAPLKGAGTQWVAAQLAGMLPDTPVYRWDRDRRDDLGALVGGEPGVVVGTTALLRLPPLPLVSLVALTLFDTHLALADFRAEEEALRLLLQLAELAPGRRPLTVVQTYQREHPVLHALASEHAEVEVETLIGRLLERRRRFGYPPFAALAKLQLGARDRASASAAADALALELHRRGAAEDDILGPAPAPVARVKGRYTYQLVLRAAEPGTLEDVLAGLPARFGGAALRVDVDPRDVGELLE